MRHARLVAIALGVCVGLVLGLGAFTFVYAKGASYLTTDPRSCANCHVMEEQFSAWVKGSHRNVATCADCHMPHDFFGKWLAKAVSGFNHSLAFTTGRFPEPIRIGKRNRDIAERTCRSCHEAITASISAHGAPPGSRESLACLRCHASVGHLH